MNDKQQEILDFRLPVVIGKRSFQLFRRRRFHNGSLRRIVANRRLIRLARVKPEINKDSKNA